MTPQLNTEVLAGGKITAVIDLKSIPPGGWVSQGCHQGAGQDSQWELQVSSRLPLAVQRAWQHVWHQRGILNILATYGPCPKGIHQPRHPQPTLVGRSGAPAGLRVLVRGMATISHTIHHLLENDGHQVRSQTTELWSRWWKWCGDTSCLKLSFILARVVVLIHDCFYIVELCWATLTLPHSDSESMFDTWKVTSYFAWRLYYSTCISHCRP